MTKLPSGPVVVTPCATSWSASSGASHQRWSVNQYGYRTARVTRKLTFAPPTGTPLYWTALPVAFTISLSLAASLGASSSALNFGRLYSSTVTVAPPSDPAFGVDT